MLFLGGFRVDHRSISKLNHRLYRLITPAEAPNSRRASYCSVDCRLLTASELLLHLVLESLQGLGLRLERKSLKWLTHSIIFKPFEGQNHLVEGHSQPKSPRKGSKSARKTLVHLGLFGDLPQAPAAQVRDDRLRHSVATRRTARNGSERPQKALKQPETRFETIKHSMKSI